MCVRPATHEDRAVLADLHTATVEAFGPDGYDAEQVEEWAGADERSPTDYTVDAAGEHFTVAVRDGAVAGFGHLVLDAGEVHAVYVHPDHARHGVGSALLVELEGYARGRGHTELALQSSLNAVGFYERAGYERVGEDESPGGLAVVEMEKSCSSRAWVAVGARIIAADDRRMKRFGVEQTTEPFRVFDARGDVLADVDAGFRSPKRLVE